MGRKEKQLPVATESAVTKISAVASETDKELKEIRPARRIGRPSKVNKESAVKNIDLSLETTNTDESTSTSHLHSSSETIAVPKYEINQRPRRQIKHKYIKSTSSYVPLVTELRDPLEIIEPIVPTMATHPGLPDANDFSITKPIRKRGRPRKDAHIPPTIIVDDSSSASNPSIILVDLSDQPEMTEEVVETCTMADESEQYELMVVDDTSQSETDVVCINDDSTQETDRSDYDVDNHGKIVVHQESEDIYLVSVEGEEDSQQRIVQPVENESIYVEVIESVDEDSVMVIEESVDDVLVEAFEEVSSHDNTSQNSTLNSLSSGDVELIYGFEGDAAVSKVTTEKKSEDASNSFVGAFSGIRKSERYNDQSTDSDDLPDSSPNAVQIAVKQLTMLGVTCISSTPKPLKKDGEISLSLGRHSSSKTNGDLTTSNCKQLTDTLRRTTRKNSIGYKPLKKVNEKNQFKHGTKAIILSDLDTSSSSGSQKSIPSEDSSDGHISSAAEAARISASKMPQSNPSEDTTSNSCEPKSSIIRKTYNKLNTLKDRMRSNLHGIFKKNTIDQSVVMPEDSSNSLVDMDIHSTEVLSKNAIEMVPSLMRSTAVDFEETEPSDEGHFAAHLKMVENNPIKKPDEIDTDDILNNITHKKYRRKTSITPIITDSNSSSPLKINIATVLPSSSSSEALKTFECDKNEKYDKNLTTMGANKPQQNLLPFVLPAQLVEMQSKSRHKPEKTHKKSDRKSNDLSLISSDRSPNRSSDGKPNNVSKDSQGKSQRKSSSKSSTNSVQSLTSNHDFSLVTETSHKPSHKSDSKLKSKSKENKHRLDTHKTEPRIENPDRKLVETENGKSLHDTPNKELHFKRNNDMDKKKKSMDSILSDCYLPKMVKHDASLYSIEAMKAAEAKRESEAKELADSKRAAEQKKLEEAAAKMASDKAMAEALLVLETMRKTEHKALIEIKTTNEAKLPEWTTTKYEQTLPTDLKLFDSSHPPLMDIQPEPALDNVETKPTRTIDDVINKSEKEETKPDSTEPNEEETNIRRSGRIKIISETKQRSQGFGLVRDRDRFHGTFSTADSSLNSSQDFMDSDCSSLSTQSISSDLDRDLSQRTEPSRVKSKEMLEKEQRDLKEGLGLFTQIIDNEFKSERNISKEAKRMTCDCFLTQTEVDRGELGCGEDCLNRLLMIECGSRCVVGNRCTNKRFQKHQNSDCTIFKTDKKGFGLMAKSFIAAGEFVMEYVGEVLNSQQFEHRAFEYSKELNKHYYFMALRSDCVIDATARGNISRFINHSCDPNAETQKWTVNGELRIGFFSTKDIYPDQEITFDYQFQRYGKEAQRCYCEAECCRGWIGEEPESGDEHEEEDDDDDDGLADDEGVEGDLIKKPPTTEIVSPKLSSPSLHHPIEDPLSMDDPLADANISSLDPEANITSLVVAKPRKDKIKPNEPKLVKKTIKMKRSEIMEDPDLDQDIGKLTKSNLKNQTQTLRFSRLMVRAKLRKAKSQLLSILRSGELACRRLFLDYHGLKLLYTWMCDSISADMRVEWEFRLEILETLEVLPIPNKLMLQESKVLVTVQKWAGLASESSAKSSPDDSSPGDSRTGPTNDCDIPKLIEQNSFIKDIEVDALKQIIVTNQSNEKKISEMTNAEQKSVAALTPTLTPVCEYPELMEEIHQIALKLVNNWEVLPEVFRIPKKLRIEQMKEHEREANRHYRALGLAEDTTPAISSKNSERFRERDKDPERLLKERETRYKPRSDFLNPNEVNLSKYHRRKQFEARVAADKEKELRQKVHTSKCTFFRLDPRIVTEQDVPFFVDPFSSQWFGLYGQPVPTPPTHVHIKPLPKKQSTKPEDYNLPLMDLPEYWKYAIDPAGRLYYYHIKIRIPQWEPPIKLMPLSDESRLSEGHPNGDPTNTDEASDSDGSSETDAESSSEDELQNKLTQLKNVIRVKKQSLNSTFVQPLNLAEEISAMATTSDGASTSAKSELAIQIESIIPQKRRKCRKNLVQEHMISPRTEEERMELRMEMRRYKVNKLLAKRRRQIAQDADGTPRKLSKLMQGLPSVANNSEDDISMEMEEKVSAHMNDDSLETTNLDDETAQNSPTLSNLVFRNRCVDELDLSQKPLRDQIRQQAAAERSLKRKKTVAEPLSEDVAKQIKQKFQRDIIGLISNYLSYYRRDTCTIGRIQNDDDFSHLTRKLSHFVMLKELKHCDNTVHVLEVTDSVKVKAKDYIRKYMVKFGSVYTRSANDPSYKDVPALS